MTNHNETLELTEKLIIGSLNASERARLEELLTENDSARKTYLRRMQFETSKQFYSDTSKHGEDDSGVAKFPFTLEQDNPGLWSNPTRASWFAVLLTNFLLIGGVIYLWLNNSKIEQPNIGSLTVVSSDSQSKQWRVGQKLNGPIKIDQGVLALRTDGGSLVSLEGPSEFEMTADEFGLLKRGKIIVYCGEKTKKITILTPSGTFADLGTEFGVQVDENKNSSLHVFDGQVFAMGTNGRDAQVVEGASSLQSDANGLTKKTGLVDLAKFEKLRESLSKGFASETFDDKKEFQIVKNEINDGWTLSTYQLHWETVPTAKLANSNPLADELKKYLLVDASVPKLSSGDEVGFVEVAWDYGSLKSVDVSQAHTIECVVRFDEDIFDFTIYGAEKPTWNERAWSVGTQTNETPMWAVYNSRVAGGQKYQFLGIEKSTTFHVLIEIDPVIGKFRTTVSDGQQRIWNELFDGSPVGLNSSKLGKIFWRGRGLSESKITFSIDSIRVCNRPVFVSDTESN